MFLFTSRNNIAWNVFFSIINVQFNFRYGPHHPEMVRKLTEMDDVIQDVFHSMSHETLLVVFGDHGMTHTGDHGGDSRNETEAGLVFLSKLKKQKQSNHPFFCPSNYSRPMSVSQVDLAATISALLGTPIPYSSIGRIIPDFLVPKIHSEAIAANVAQVHRYVLRYTDTTSSSDHNSQTLPSMFSSTSSETGKTIMEEYKLAVEAFNAYQHNPSLASRASLNQLSVNYLLHVKNVAVTTWTQFDIPMICVGLFITLVSVSCLVMYLISVPFLLKDAAKSRCRRNSSILGRYSALCWLWPMLPQWSILCSFLLYSKSRTALMAIVVSTFVGLGVFIVLLCMKIAQSTKSRSRGSEKQNKTRSLTVGPTINLEPNNYFWDFSEIVSVLLYTFTCFGVLSNSFVINEGYFLGSVLTGVVILHILCSNRITLTGGEKGQTFYVPEDGVAHILLKRVNRCSWSCFFMFAILIRTSHVFFRCREELTECEEVNVIN